MAFQKKIILEIYQCENCGTFNNIHNLIDENFAVFLQ